MLYDGHTSLLKQAGFILPMLSTQRAIEPCWQRHTKKTRTCVFASNYMMLLQTPVWQFDPLRVGQNKIWLTPGYKAKKTQTKCHINTKIRIHQLFGRRKSFYTLSFLWKVWLYHLKRVVAFNKIGECHNMYKVLMDRKVVRLIYLINTGVYYKISEIHMKYRMIYEI